MAKQLQLSIADPCHEDWDKMTPAAKGRFCGSCQKQVVDFSTMSDRQVAEFFKKPSTGSVCGRFMSDQLDRDIEIPKKRIPWVKYFFQFALPAFLLSLKPSPGKTQGQVRSKILQKEILHPPVNEKRIECTIDLIPLKKDTAIKPIKPTVLTLGRVAKPVCNKPLIGDTTSVPTVPMEALQEGLTGRMGGLTVRVDDSKTIRGKVVDQKGDPLPGASVRVKNTRSVVTADNNGQFRLQAYTGNVLAVFGAGLETTELIVKKSQDIIIVMKRTVVGFIGYRIKPKKEIKNVPLLKQILKDTAFNSFKVFPNPVSPGSRITIEARQAEEGDYTLHLLNQSGQLVHQQEIRIDAEVRSFSIDAPPVAAGTYFIVFTNKESGKKFSEKIIIQ